MTENFSCNLNLKLPKVKRVSKKVQKRTSSKESVEITHKKKLEHFKLLEKSLPKKESKLKKMIEDKESKEEIELLQEEINKIKEKEEENDYFLTTYKIFDKYLKISDTIQQSNNEDIFDLSSKDALEKLQIIKQYYEALNMTHLVDFRMYRNDEISMCKYCNVENQQTDISFVCTECGLEEIDNVGKVMSYKELQDREFKSRFAYKRMNHFNDWLAQIQSQENTELPEEIIDLIIVELDKQRVKDLSNLDRIKMRAILKKIGYSKYYEHIPSILTKITGKSLKFTFDLIEKFKTMFSDIQKPFEKYKEDRKNFFSYPYILFKFCELLEEDSYLEHFSLLKSKEKLHKQDELWKKVCLDLGWEFNAT